MEFDRIMDLIEQFEDYPTNGTPRQCVKYGIEIAFESVLWRWGEQYREISGMDKP